jgi:hypothetical protein
LWKGTLGKRGEEKTVKKMYECNEYVNTFFRRKSNEHGFSDVAIIECGFPPNHNTAKVFINRRLMKFIQITPDVKSNEDILSIAQMFLSNLNNFMRNATFSSDQVVL